MQILQRNNSVYSRDITRAPEEKDLSRFNRHNPRIRKRVLSVVLNL